MSKIVKKSHLESVVSHLWTKVKEKLDKTFIDANYEKDTQKLKFEQANGVVKEVELTDLASKTLDNVFEGNNTFKDLNLGLSEIATMTIPDGGHLAGAINLIKTGNREVYSHVNQSNGYVKNLVFRVDNKSIGDNIRVNVWEVKKGATKDLDTPKELYSNLELEVVNVSNYWGGGAVGVRCPINKKYNEDTYFIYQTLESNTLFRRASINPPKDNYISISANDPVNRDSIINSQGDIVGIHLLELGNVGIGDLISGNKGGTVTSVNGKKPDTQGAVNVEIADIQGLQTSLDNKIETSKIGNSAGKIPEVQTDGKLASSIMPDLAITDVHVVANENEMMQLTVQVGDVVVVTDEGNKTYMCKNGSATNKNDKFIEINMGFPIVKGVNGQKPDKATGELTLDGTHINATVGGHNNTIQNHLQTANNNIDAAHNNINSINSVVSSLSRDVSTVTSDLGNVKTTINNHNTRISRIESKKHSVKVGEVISTLNTTLGESYAIDGVTFLYIGREKLISRNDYPQLSEALGITSGVNFNTPVIADITFRYDYNSKTATRKHYIVAKV